MTELWINKLKLLCWKNWIITKRQRFFAIPEVLFPILLFFATLIIVKLNYNDKVTEKPSELFNINTPQCFVQSKNISEILYTPNNEFYNDLIEKVSIRFAISFRAIENETELNKMVIKNQTNPTVGIIFEPITSDSVKHLKYTIRMPDDSSNNNWNTNKLYYIGLSANPRPNSYPPKSSIYYSSCFLKLQNEIDQLFIKISSNGTASKKLKELKSFPVFIKNRGYLETAVYGFPILFVTFVLFSAIVLIKNITIESKSRLTESMRIMGLSSFLYWLSWFMRSFIILLISFTIIVILTAVSIFANSNPLIIWIFFISYITSIITFCFLVSVIFKKSSRAGIVGSIVFIATILPYIMYHDSFYRFSYGLKALFCMLTNTNMGLGIKMVLMSELNDGGVGFGTLFERSVDLKFSLGELLFFMNIGNVLQMLLTIYVEKVVYDEIEITKLWNDFISFVYIKLNSIKRPRMNSRNSLHEVEMRPFHSKSNNKEVLGNLGEEIVIKDLSKKIGKEYAVQNMSLNLNKNKITVLVGPKRAGKTTVLSLLTGLCKPTSGTAIINGYDITTYLDKARSSMGVCLQYNALFEELTVQENLEFFCKLKEMSDIQNQIEKYANLLGIFDKLTNQIRTLNDEQKKKLSIAIALCGDSKFIILDEPMSGIDESSRQQLWDLLNSEKDNRTFLITANFMDDIPGDNIAIITEGQLKTVGSLANLKKKFEIGYRLICVKENGFKSQAVLDVIKNAVKEANTKPVADAKIGKQDMKDVPQSDALEVEVCEDKVEVLDDKEESDKMEKTMQKDYSLVSLEHESETEAVFVIPEDNLPIFSIILKFLEDKLESLKILTIKCRYTSLEDVIVRMSFENHENVENSNQISKIPKNNEDQTVINMKEPEKEFKKCDKNFAILQQFYAMFLKKYFVLRQSWIMLISIGIASLLTILLIPKLFSVRPDRSTQLQISFNSYGDTEILVEFESNSTISEKFITLFSETDKIDRISPKKIEADILEKYKNPQSRVNQINLIAATIKNDELIAWFNTQPYHTMPLTVNTINRAILKSVTGNDYDISVTNHPFSFKDLRHNSIVGFFVIVFLLVVWPLIYIGNYIKERKIRFKFLQFICDTKQLVYWFTNLIFDYILFIIICLVLFLCFVCFNYEMDQWLEEFRILMTVGSSYGFSWICFIYAFSYLFSKPSTGETMLLLLSILLSVLSEFDHVLYSETADPFFAVIILRYIAMMFAPFSLVKMFHEFYSGTRPFAYSTLDDFIVMNITSGCIFFLVVLLTDYKVFTCIYYKLKKPAQNTSSTVRYSNKAILTEENQVVNSNNIEESAQHFTNLLKTYKNITAVNQLSINDEQNAANIKTTFKIITGDESITSGDVWIKRKSLKTQFDNFIPELTGRNILKIFALIRGIKMNEINQIIKQKAVEFKIEDYLDEKVKNFSGEERKKLFSVLTLLGYPDVLFLDECKKADDRNKLMKLSKMEENEALSSRIGIMVAGQFQCLQPIQYLKNKFLKGFVLTIKTGFTDEDKIKKLREVVVQKFLDVKLTERYLDMLKFHLNNDHLKLSEIFIILEEIKEEMAIKDYKLTHMSLEQVILNISKQETPFTQEEVIQMAEEEEKWKKEEEAEREAKIMQEMKIKQKVNKRALKLGMLLARKEKELKQKEIEHKENEDKIEFGKKTKKLEEKLAEQKEKKLAKQKEKKQKEQMELERIEMDKNNQKEIEDKETKKFPGKSRWVKTKNWLSEHSPLKNRISMAKKSNKTEDTSAMLDEDDEKKSNSKEQTEGKSTSSEYYNKQKDKRQYIYLTGRPMNDEESIEDSSDTGSDDLGDNFSKMMI